MRTRHYHHLTVMTILMFMYAMVDRWGNVFLTSTKSTWPVS
jgi:hypothetical protein